jgi:hypothetical protein
MCVGVMGDSNVTDETIEPNRLRFGFTVYQQVTGILGAFALIALLGHIADFEWRGFIADLINFWNGTVRPAVAVVFEWLISKPLMWIFGWNFKVPLIVRDYLSVGTVCLLSFYRAAHSFGGKVRDDEGEDDFTGMSVYWEVMSHFKILIILGWLLWPISFPYMLREFFTAGESIGRYAAVLMAAPVAYLGLLLAVNYLVLSP